MVMHLQLTATFNRATLLSRALFCYLEQDCDEESIMLIFNTGEPLVLEDFQIPENKQVILINRQENFPSIGAKYMEAMKYIPEGVTTVNILDDDDMAKPQHIRLGIKGLKESNKSAYKPSHSWFHHLGQLTLESNTFEGSIFMTFEHLKKYGFQIDKNVKYHDGWLLPLVKDQDISVDSKGFSTFIYDWHTPVPCYKMSGREEGELNYQISKFEARDTGNGLLRPSKQHIIWE